MKESDGVLWGSMGFEIKINEKRIVNMGDTLLEIESWREYTEPDILMIPIGGEKSKNTMNVEEAILATKFMRPKVVIPCHYKVPALFSKNYCPANDVFFKQQVEKLGIKCSILSGGESFHI